MNDSLHDILYRTITHFTLVPETRNDIVRSLRKVCFGSASCNGVGPNISDDQRKLYFEAKHLILNCASEYMLCTVPICWSTLDELSTEDKLHILHNTYLLKVNK